MQLTFEPSKKLGRHIYRVYGNRRDWFKADGTPATPTESDAIAQGWIGGESRITQVLLSLIETTRDTDRAIGNAYSKWALTAPQDQYGARSPFESFSIVRATHGQTPVNKHLTT